MRQPYRIESITLRDIGVFEHTRFDFPLIENIEADNKKAEIHIFTGPNGCGKSTLLYALAAIFRSDMPPLIHHRYRNRNSQVDFKFASSNGRYGTSAKAGHYYDYDNIRDNNILAMSNEPYKRKRANEFAAFAYSGHRAPQSNFSISAIQEITASPFENALSFDQTVRPSVLTQWIANNRTNAALAKADGAHSEAANYDIALNKISEFIYQICNINIKFQLKRSPLNVILNIDGLQLNFDILPEGLKSILCWVVDLALRLDAIPWEKEQNIFSQPIFLFLDEVDIHLHPKWQRRILPAIQKLLPNAQVFVSTHSPFVVGSVEDAWVYRLSEPQQNICRDPHIADVIKPEPSSAGKSYQLILDEVFGVPEQFDVETEQQLAEFYRLRKSYLANPTDDSQLKALANLLSQKSEEVSAIISMELRQLARLTKKD